MKFSSVKKSDILRKGALMLPSLGMLCLGSMLTSCESLHDDMSDCRSGIQLAFNYDYHMEPGANAFPANVDCVTVYVCDPQGNYLTQFTETSDVLRDENYRMELPLDKGSYHLVVYGGTTCDDATVDFTPQWTPTSTGGHKDHILVTVPTDENGESRKQLHDIEARTGGLFYGTLDVTLTDRDFTAGAFREETVHLMKDTNTIQVFLQELANPDKMNHEDYEFTITDDNFTLDGYNNPVYASTKAPGESSKSYKPYVSETRLMGYTDPSGRDGSQAYEDEARQVKVACAEFSTSRLLTQHMESARLKITSTRDKDDNGNPKEIINIPLITYLAMTRGYGESWIKSDQEYLDRQSRWHMMFFLQRNVWVKTSIVVNSWIVRLDPIKL